jgi:proteasome accessory factor C
VSDTAAAQLRRVLDLIPVLARGERVSHTEVARKVGIDVDTLLSDLYSIAERFDEPGGYVESVGITIESSTVAVSSSHFLRPMRLTMAELCALDLGLAMLRAESSPDEHCSIDGARRKLHRVITKLPANERHEHLRSAETGANGDTEHLALLRRAVQAKRKVQVSYEGSGGEGLTLRVIHPYALLAARGAWYVVAHCERSKGLRVFRLDRICEARYAVQRFELPEGFSLEALIRDGRVFSSSVPDRLVVRYSPRIARWIAEREGRQLSEDGSVTVDYPLADVSWAARHVLQYGPDAEALSPATVRDEIRRRLKAIMS